uniref:Arginyl-tRNA--protein transferase 1 n=1 Tax=Neolamprologus brichardi TaxID=32507 RepID=A0A3Q4HBF9_NEOBR
MAGNKSYTIVEYFGGEDGYRCGYCKSQTGNFSRGMWSHTMTVQDYQDLIDRGWRRSGKYVYKPIMQKTCCPQYTIRCHALKFQPSKSHKKILKKMNRFISKGELQKGQEDCAGEPMDSVCEEAGPQELRKVHLKCTALTDIQKDATEFPSTTEVQKEAADATPTGSQTSQNDPVPVLAGTTTSAAPKPGRNHLNYFLFLNCFLIIFNNHLYFSHCFLHFIVNSCLPIFFLKVRLVRSNPPSPQFKASFDASYQVYKLYQMAIHKDPPDKPTESQVRGWEAEYAPDGPEVGYGSFHQQYWLDGRIVAVGVIDILPTCVSSVYLYYHPDFNSLSLGSYSALREIAFTKQLQKQSPKLSYYYLGFYIHSCPKMRYKGQYRPSDLLCPETYVWVSIERCIPLLDNSRYARLNQDPDLGDARAVRDLGRALVLYRRTVMPYAAYSRKRKGSSDEMEVQQYASLVGQDCAERILLYRS